MRELNTQFISHATNSARHGLGEQSMPPEELTAILRRGEDVAVPRWLRKHRPDERLDALEEYDWWYGPTWSAGEIGRRVREVIEEYPPYEGGAWTAEALARHVPSVPPQDVEALVEGRYGRPLPSLVAAVAVAVGVPRSWMWDRAVQYPERSKPMWWYRFLDALWRGAW